MDNEKKEKSSGVIGVIWVNGVIGVNGVIKVDGVIG